MRHIKFKENPKVVSFIFPRQYKEKGIFLFICDAYKELDNYEPITNVLLDFADTYEQDCYDYYMSKPLDVIDLALFLDDDEVYAAFRIGNIKFLSEVFEQWQKLN